MLCRKHIFIWPLLYLEWVLNWFFFFCFKKGMLKHTITLKIYILKTNSENPTTEYLHCHDASLQVWLSALYRRLTLSNSVYCLFQQYGPDSSNATSQLCLNTLLTISTCQLNTITFFVVWFRITLKKTVNLCVAGAVPHTVPSSLSPVVGTRCSVSSQHVLGDCCYLHMYTDASASENHTPGLHTNNTQRLNNYYICDNQF